MWSFQRWLQRSPTWSSVCGSAHHFFSPAKDVPRSAINANYGSGTFAPASPIVQLRVRISWSRFGFALRRWDLCKVGDPRRTRLCWLRCEEQQVLQTVPVRSCFHVESLFYRVWIFGVMGIGWQVGFRWTWPDVGFINLTWIAPVNVPGRQTVSTEHKCFMTAAL